MRQKQTEFTTALARRGLAGVGVALLLCCRGTEQSGAADRQPNQTEATVDERVQDLKATFPNAVVQLDLTGRRVTSIRRLTVATAATTAEEIARSGLRVPAVRSALGLSSDLRQLCAPTTRRDVQLANRAIVRMSQCVDGVKVLGAELVMSVSLKPSPSIESLTSSLVADPPARAVPRVSADAAIRMARNAVTGSAGAQAPPSTTAATNTPELVVFVPALFQLDGPTRLCWSVRVAEMIVLVDALDGSVVRRYSEAIR